MPTFKTSDIKFHIVTAVNNIKDTIYNVVTKKKIGYVFTLEVKNESCSWQNIGNEIRISGHASKSNLELILIFLQFKKNDNCIRLLNLKLR